MPTGSREEMAMSDMTQWTEAELLKEFDGRPRDAPEGEVEEEEEGEEREGGTSRTPSTDRHSFSSGRLTPSTSLPSLSDATTSEDQERKKEGAMAEVVEGKKRRNSAHLLWKSVKKAGTELNQDTRRAFRYLGRKLYSRHEPRKTKVKEIHILPGEEHDGMWARRLAGTGSAHSGSSTSSDPST